MLKSLFLFLCISGCACAAFSEAQSNLPPLMITYGPWVTTPDVGAVTIGFVTDINTGAGIEYRIKGSDNEWSSRWHTEAGQLISTSNRHAIRLTGLDPESQYEYRIVLFIPPQKQEGDNKFRAQSELRLPRTLKIEDDAFNFRPFSTEETYSFFVVSDLQFPTERRHQILQNYHDNGMKDSRFVVLLGDLTNSIDNIETDILQGIIEKTTALGGASQPHLFIRGNHEWRGLQSDLWTSYFAMPGGSTYAAFRCGDAFYIVLDTGEDKPPYLFTAHYTTANIAEQEFMDSQKAWLTSVVESQEFKAAKFRIVLAHSAPYSHAGRYMSRVINNLVEDFFTSDNPDNRIHLWISGHTHFYARTIPGTTQAYALCQPIKKFYRDDRYSFPVVTLDGPTFNGPEGDLPTSGLKVAVEKERLFLESIREDGTVFDRFEVLPDGSINDLNKGLSSSLFTFEPL